MLRGIRPDFSGLSPCCGQVAYVLLTRAPVAGGIALLLSPAAPRLACVKPVASVHPEPGSNSSLLVYCLFSFSVEKGDNTLLLYCYQNGSLKAFPGRVSLLLNALELTEKMYPPRVSPRRLVLLYYFVYCKSFNVLSRFPAAPASGAKSSAKLRRISELTKFFGKKISFFLQLSASLPGSPEKRVQSYYIFRPYPNFFATFFRKILPHFHFRLIVSNLEKQKNVVKHIFCHR